MRILKTFTVKVDTNTKIIFKHMKQYTFTLQSDTGRHTLTVTATGIVNATMQVLSAQSAPEQAIVNIKIK